MTAKEYLSQARTLDMRIKSKLQQIESLNELATSCTAVYSDMPRNPNRGSSKVERAVLKIIEVEESLKHDVEDLVELKKEIMATIQAVSDVELQTLLEKRYLCFLSWEKIAVEIDGLRTGFRLALAIFDEEENGSLKPISDSGNGL